MKWIQGLLLTLLLATGNAGCKTRTDDGFFKKYKDPILASSGIVSSLVLSSLIAVLYLGYIKAKNRPFIGNPEPLKMTHYSKTDNPHAHVIFAHGLGDSPQTVSQLANSGKIFDPHTETITFFNFADVSGDINTDNPYPAIPNPEYTYLAQGDEIDRLDTVIETVKKNEKPIVGIGHSRGAGTWLTTLGTKKQTVAALVLFAPFTNGNDQIEYYVQNAFGIFGKIIHAIPFSSSFLHKSASLIFRKYNPKGVQPITCAPHVAPEIPILLVHSTHDKIMPVNESRKLYCTLKESDHEKIYLAEIDNIPVYSPIENHMLITTDTCAQNIVHAFYKKFNLPYNAELAKDIDLSEYQPPVEEVRERINQK